jgi:hypothetical protein
MTFWIFLMSIESNKFQPFNDLLTVDCALPIDLARLATVISNFAIKPLRVESFRCDGLGADICITPLFRFIRSMFRKCSLWFNNTLGKILCQYISEYFFAFTHIIFALRNIMYYNTYKGGLP